MELSEDLIVDLLNHMAKETVSFLTYLLKSFADYIRPHEESICKSIVNLLVTCSDSVSIRKELLVALKHVLGTDFKRGLFPLIDTLLEERVLVGTGRACFETLRPLAYSLLAELVHHVRGDLSLSQTLTRSPTTLFDLRFGSFGFDLLSPTSDLPSRVPIWLLLSLLAAVFVICFGVALVVSLHRLFLMAVCCPFLRPDPTSDNLVQPPIGLFGLQFAQPNFRSAL
ncbi:phosphotransferases/inositol or phosphatidylinositol kinase [Actinidia rufa]|uniref:Phosphotransferases/inositol or phosphatidylinositol kinase n=1 Tax=Actinidia rufa TaxID=165716 RepID=A0A7J0EN28_9ERIC|nr:phosphotransferases/inositol or phosphatidylinositol kinase [Actinidia rufa]